MTVVVADPLVEPGAGAPAVAVAETDAVTVNEPVCAVVAVAVFVTWTTMVAPGLIVTVLSLLETVLPGL